MLNEPVFCEFCVAENELQLELQERGFKIHQCPNCCQLGGRALSANDARLGQIFRALVRLNFSEWDYNTHLGGESLQSVVATNNAIFNYSLICSQLDFDEAFLTLAESLGWYPQTDDGIALGGGYWDGHILDGVRDRRDSEVESLVKDALEHNWFEIEPAARKLVNSLLSDISTVIKPGTEFFRGRLGVESRTKRKYQISKEARKFYYSPFKGKDIDRPPIARATDGRFNRIRVSALYLASNTDTAVSELRPHPGHLISTVKFRLKRSLRVANFANHDIRDFLSDQRLEDLRTILSIADVLNVPVQPEQHSLYAITQLFSDALRLEGFEGLTYQSSVAAGSNLTCFANDAFEMVEGSECVQEVVSLNYKIAELQILPQDYDKDDFVQDENNPLATLLHGMARHRS